MTAESKAPPSHLPGPVAQSAEGAAGQWPQEFWFFSKFKL